MGEDVDVNEIYKMIFFKDLVSVRVSKNWCS